MLVQALRNLNPLALLDPELPGAIPPQPPADEWGINLAAARLNFPNQGLKVQIPVWSNKSLADKVELLLDNNVVAQQTISDPIELTERATLFVNPNRLKTGAYELTYRVTRFGQQPELFTPPLKLDVKLEQPAGQDTDPDYGHSELYMEFRPPEIVQDGVDKDTAENGVDILVVAKPGSASKLPYPNIAVGDVIWVSWGGELVASDPVTQEQIDDPVNHPIVIHISKEIIEAAGDSGLEGLAVSFYVEDRVKNQSEDWCKETRIVVDTGSSSLDAPIVKDANGDKLDLDILGDKDVTLQIWLGSTAFQRNDDIVASLTGLTEDGESIDIEVRKPIENVPAVMEISFPNAAVRALAKTQARFSYKHGRAGTVIQRSKGRFIHIIGEAKQLLAPIAKDENQGALDPDLDDVIIIIPFNESFRPGMVIDLDWLGIRPDTSTYNPELPWYFLTDEDIEDGIDIIIIVTGHLKPLEGGTLTLSYTLLSEGENGETVSRPSLHAAPLNVGEPTYELVKAIVLGEQSGALDPDNLPNGVSQLTAPRPTVNPTKANDVVTYSWVGEVTGKKENSITLNSLSKDKDVRFALNAQFVEEHIKPNHGKKVTASYRIWRAETNTTSYSNRLEFVIGEASGEDDSDTPIGSGTLKVMGARSNRSGYRAYSAFSKLSAFDATTGKPLPAQWKYADATNWSTASPDCIDDHPHKLLQVRTSNDQVTLNSANIIGNGIDTTVVGGASFMAHDDKRGVVGWGNAAHGSTVPPTIITMKDVQTVRSTTSAYAALRDNKSVVVWGNPAEGANMAGVSPLNFKAIIGNATAFAGIKDNGTVVAWGTPANGGTVPAAISALTDIVQLYAAGQAFVAQQATGFIVAWGQAGNGGTIPPEIAVLDDIQTIIGNLAAFAAFRPNGTVVAWGHASYGGTVPAAIAALTNIQGLVCASEQAFAVILTTREVRAWGPATHGGTVDPLIETLTDIEDVSATRSAFAARRKNGHVVAWGNQAEGGLVPAAIAALNNIVQVVGSSMAFAALCQDGTVVVWGNATVGGDVSAVASLLVNVVAIYANTHGFTALTSDGRVVTWGQAAGGGNSSAVQGQLAGKVSYLATAAP